MIILKSIQNPLGASHITEGYHGLRSIGTQSHPLPYLWLQFFFFLMGSGSSSTLQVQDLPSVFCAWKTLAAGAAWLSSSLSLHLYVAFSTRLSLTTLCIGGPYCFHPASSPPFLPLCFITHQHLIICFTIL